MHFSWERMPQLTQVRYQYEVSSKEGDKKKSSAYKTLEDTCDA